MTIKRGLKGADEGRVVSFEEVKERVMNCSKFQDKVNIPEINITETNSPAYHTFNIQHLTFNIQHLTFNIQHLTFNIYLTRIIIIGNGGTGKSTLGEKLGKILNLEVTHLDKMTYNPGWIRVDENVFRKKLNEIISKESWIVEGWSYHSTLRQRMEASTIIIYLKYSIFTCYWYALLRHIKYFYRQNPYDPDDSPILNKTGKMVKAMWLVYKKYEPEFQNMLKDFENKKVLVFESRKELNKFVRQLEKTKEIK